MVDIHLAADGLSLITCTKLVKQLGQHMTSIKVHDLVDSYGKKAVEDIRKAGASKVWIDYKLHDIPKTVKKRAQALFNIGASIITVHTSDIDMMSAALESGAEIYGVTLLTSISAAEAELIAGHGPKAVVLYRAQMAKMAGLHGIVASAEEVGMLAARSELKGMKFIIPGTRSPGVDIGDQKRVDTPEATVRNGATGLVVGSEVTNSNYPVAAFDKFYDGALRGLDMPD